MRNNPRVRRILYGGLAVTLAAAAFLGAGFASKTLLSRDFSDPRFLPRSAADFPDRAAIEAILAETQKTLEAEPADLKALMRAGIAYFALGREHAVEAINRFEDARLYGATDPRIFYYLGRLYSLVGLPQFAVPEFERFLRHRAADSEVMLELGRLHYQLGNYAQSSGFYEKLLANRRDPMVIENLALVNLKLKDWEKARDLFEELRSDQKNYSPETSFFLAEAQRELGNCEEAVSLYDEAARIPLEPQKKVSLLEGKLVCLEKMEPAEPADIAGVAQELLQADPKNAAAKRVNAKFKKKSSKRS